MDFLLQRQEFHFYISWKRQKTKGFLTFSGGIEVEHWAKGFQSKGKKLKDSFSVDSEFISNFIQLNQWIVLIYLQINYQE